MGDLILRGFFDGCESIAARYIETGEKEENLIVADRIGNMNKAGS